MIIERRVDRQYQRGDIEIGEISWRWQHSGWRCQQRSATLLWAIAAHQQHNVTRRDAALLNMILSVGIISCNHYRRACGVTYVKSKKEGGIASAARKSAP